MEWKESVTVPIIRVIKQTVVIIEAYHFCLQHTKILSNILLLSLTPYAEGIIANHQCGLRRNRSTTDHIFCIRQILEKNREYNETVHQLLIEFKKAYDSVRR